MLLRFLMLLLLPTSLLAYGCGGSLGLPGPTFGIPGPSLFPGPPLIAPPPMYQRPPCGPQPYMQQTYQQPQVHPPIQPIQQQYYYPTSSMIQNTYAQAPQSLPQAAEFDKDLTTPAPELIKTAEYDRFEEKLAQLKPATTIEPYEPSINVSTTYIRELPVPQPYLPRPLPYRPHPMIPRGCPVLPPQYLRPMPYMPRGYVQPLPYVTPPPQLVPQPVPPPPIVPQQQTYAISSISPSPAPMFPVPNNDCCGRCHAPCRLQKNNYAQGSKTYDEHSVPKREVSEEKKDSRCSSTELKEVMLKSTTHTTSITKRLIQKTAEERFGEYFSVVCSREDFSYVARSELFCQTEKNGIFCYAFQHK